jgi:hypothetical protein
MHLKQRWQTWGLLFNRFLDQYICSTLQNTWVDGDLLRSISQNSLFGQKVALCAANKISISPSWRNASARQVSPHLFIPAFTSSLALYDEIGVLST